MNVRRIRRGERLRVQSLFDFRRKLLTIQVEKRGILTDKTLCENAGRQPVESLVLDRFEKARGDLQFPGDVVQIEIAANPLAAQGLANGAHTRWFPRPLRKYYNTS